MVGSPADSSGVTNTRAFPGELCCNQHKSKTSINLGPDTHAQKQNNFEEVILAKSVTIITAAAGPCPALQSCILPFLFCGGYSLSTTYFPP